MKLPNLTFIAVLLLLAPQGAFAQLEPPSTGGLPELDRLLQRIAEPRRLLMIGAHPDDEDTSVLSLVSLSYGAQAAYLSLSRGEGGQNLIGNELGPALGLLRSRELLAARSVDGTRQFFTRAYDFGYTRSLDETASKWPLDSLLKDAVRVVRRYRPHVIVSVFSGTPRDGHGQHQAAGVTARSVFDAAGDPDRFPELATEEGLAPWRPLRLFRSTRFDPDAASVRVETGMLDQRQGRSIYQIAMESRSRHRSQDMGRLQPIGPQQSSMLLVADRLTGASETSTLFEGIDPDASELARFADSLRARVTPRNLDRVAEWIAARLVSHGGDPDEEGRLLGNALAIAAGVVTDAVAERAEAVPGETFGVRVSVYNGGVLPVDLMDIAFDVPEGWIVERGDGAMGAVASGTLMVVPFTLQVPQDAAPTQPYFLARPLNGSMYDWSEADARDRGAPFQAPVVQVAVRATVAGATIELNREATYRVNDQAIGEIRREVRVVPAVDVRLDPGQVVWPANGEATRSFVVRLAYNGAAPYRGEVRLETGDWVAPAPQRFAFARRGEVEEFEFVLARPPDRRNDRIAVRAVAVGDDRRVFDLGLGSVEYPHIRPTTWIRAARADVRLAPIELPVLRGVGYVRGAADRVPEALAEIGVPITILDEDDLAGGDLSRFDAIVVGSRAYEIDPALARHNDRLLEYGRGGGLLIVQYQQYAFVSGDYTPFALDIARPHDRVTDENAPVTLLEPDHPVFHGPNSIGPADWEDWPQERGLYFAHSWDGAYRPLLEMNDPGQDPIQGALLVAPHGKGTYVYTGLSFFRALPAGNLGAFKLFLNLLGLRTGDAP